MQAQTAIVLPADVVGALDRAYVFVDLEVNSEGSIYRMGLVAPPTERDYPIDHLHDGFAALSALHAHGAAACCIRRDTICQERRDKSCRSLA